MDTIEGFKLINRNDRDKYIVLTSICYDAKVHQNNSLKSCLKKAMFTGTIYFDLLLNNGSGSTRFIKFFVENGVILKKSLQQFTSISIREMSEDFLKDNPTLVENSILSRDEKDKVLNNA